MLNPLEYGALVDMERDGTELSPEAKLEMAKYDESLNEVFELVTEYFGDDGELN